MVPRVPERENFTGPQRFVVTPTQAGQRLDRVVASITGTTRSHVKRLIEAGCVHVAGVSKKAGYCVRAGEEIDILPVPDAPPTATPQEIPLEVLYEDEYVMAINKPAGMVVHPAPGQWQGTVVNALLFRWGRTESPHTLRPGIVHRLDKDTSGVLLIAKDSSTQEHLARQFKDRRVHKTYIAVVAGRFPAPCGAITLPIGRHPVDRKKMSVRTRHGREAVSRYQVVAESNGISLLRLFPETGRTHQLRVHLAAIGHPIVGDTVYGSRSALKHHTRAATFPRQALHAEAICFSHPATGAPLTIHAPYPEDFARLLKELQLTVQ